MGPAMLCVALLIDEFWLMNDFDFVLNESYLYWVSQFMKLK